MRVVLAGGHFGYACPVLLAAGHALVAHFWVFSHLSDAELSLHSMVRELHCKGTSSRMDSGKATRSPANERFSEKVGRLSGALGGLVSHDATARLVASQVIVFLTFFCLSSYLWTSGTAYSGMYALYCLLVLLTTIVATYGCLTEILDHGLSFKEAGLFLIAFYCVTLLCIICNEAHAASRKMGPEFR